MKTLLSADAIISKTFREYKARRPDLLVALGDRILNLIQISAERSAEARELSCRLVDLHALQFVDLVERRLLCLDDETEYGRKVSTDLFTALEHNRPKWLTIHTTFLSDTSDSKRIRTRVIIDLKKRGSAGKVVASALENIAAFERLPESGLFHQRVFRFGQLIQSLLDRPSNSDATVIHVSCQQPLPEDNEPFSRNGTIIEYSEKKFTLVPDFSISPLPLNICGLTQRGLALCRIRCYMGNNSMKVSPMVYLPIEFPTVRSNCSVPPDRLLAAMTQAFKKHVRHDAGSRQYKLALYDLVGFWLDVCLFRAWYTTMQKEIPFSNATLDQATCISHYGHDLGKSLLLAIAETLGEPSASMVTAAPAFFDDEPVTIGPSEFLLIKSACLRSYARGVTNDFKSYPERRGLSFEGLSDELHLGPIKLMAALDVLSDRLLVKPFNQVEKLTKGGLVLNRVYNTETPDFIGVYYNFIRQAEKRGIPIGKFNLNKFSILMHCFFLFREDRRIRIIRTKEGKTVMYDVMGIDEEMETINLHKLLIGENGDKFDFDTTKHMYRVKVSPAIQDAVAHVSVVDRYQFSGFTEAFFEIYNQLDDCLKQPPPHCVLEDHRRNIYDLFGAFVDLIGQRFPESGLLTPAELMAKALHLLDRHFSGATADVTYARTLLADSVPHKLRLIREFHDMFLHIYRELARRSTAFHEDIWRKMAVMPTNSLVVGLYERIVERVLQDYPGDLAEVKRLQKKVHSFVQLMQDICDGRKRLPNWLTPGKAGLKRTVVSVDLMNSTKLRDSGEERWMSTRDYLMRIASAWARFVDAKRISEPGDEIIVACMDPESAMRFAIGAAVHINEVAESINAVGAFDFPVGCRAKVTSGIVAKDSNGIYESKALNHMKDLPKLKGQVACDRASGEDLLRDGHEPVQDNENYLVFEPRRLFEACITQRLVGGS